MPGAATLSTPDLWTQSFQWLHESRTIPIFIGRNWGFQPQSLGRGHTLSNGEAASPQPAVGPGNPPTHPQTAPAHRSPRRGPQHHWNLLVSSHPCPPLVWGQQKTNAETETLARPLPTEVIFGLQRNRAMMLKTYILQRDRAMRRSKVHLEWHGTTLDRYKATVSHSWIKNLLEHI